MSRAVHPGGDRFLAEAHASVEAYYTAKVSRYGATPLGVDWSCVPTQELRFVQLLKVCDFGSPFSLNDVGCGYGALLAYLARRHPEATIDYLGLDLSSTMVRHARRLWRSHDRATFTAGAVIPRAADYSVASGVFNVKLDQPIDRWERLVARTLSDLHACSRRGFAVNFMATEAGRAPQPDLYQTAPEPWVRFCEQELGTTVTLVAVYGLREFTLLAHR